MSRSGAKVSKTIGLWHNLNLIIASLKGSFNSPVKKMTINNTLKKKKLSYKILKNVADGTLRTEESLHENRMILKYF